MIVRFPKTNPKRLDKFLKESNIDGLFSRSMIERLISEKHILVNSKFEKKSYKLQPNDEISIEIPEVKPSELKPVNLNLNVIFEDEYLALIEKPINIVTHPGKGNSEGTLVHGLLHQFNNLSNFNGSERAGIVHRLDKDTSGIMIIAKNNKVHALLSDMFRNRKINKYYKTIVAGSPSEKEGTIETHIRRSRRDPTKMYASKTGRKAISHYKILEYYDFFSLLEIKLETGRTHQIRVHMSHINHPILGEEVYSTRKRILQYVPAQMQKRVNALLGKHLKRQALHAYKLEFEHPITKEQLSFTSELPEDFQYAIKWLKNNFLSREEL
ncbi:MAG: RluA family pseudouridine synthase [Candidatus Cloacimonadota bacterium]|nr:RluA family pseudouridine synthase [Candidatus Cloacimonadota bacterium]